MPSIKRLMSSSPEVLKVFLAVAVWVTAVFVQNVSVESVVHASSDVPFLFAQAQPDAEAAPPAQRSVVTTSGRSFWLEAIVVAVLFAGALFAVCRSSNRT